MRLKLIALALMATTAMVTPALADPISIFVIVTATLQSTIGVFATSLLYGAIQIAAGAALSALVGSLLAPKGSANTVRPPQELVSNFAQEIPDRFWAMGKCRIGGNLALGEQKGGQLSKLIAHCDAEATEELGLYLNDILVTLDEDGYVTDAEFLLDSGAKVIQLESRPGTGDQVAMPTLTARFSEWTEDHIGAGVADTLMTIAPVSQANRSQIYRHRGVLGLGEPDISRVARWGRYYDPRNDSTNGGTGSERYDDPATWGPALGNLPLMIVAHRMDPERFAMAPEDIDWVNIAEQADIADITVVDRYGANVPLYHGGIVFSKNATSYIEGENAMLSACDGIRREDESGKFGILIGRYYEPTLILTDADIFEIASSEADNGESVFTHLSAKYTEPQFAYKSAATLPFVNTDIWSEGDQVTSREIQLYAVQHINHAFRMLKALARQSSAERQLNVVAGPRAKRAREHRFIRLDLADAQLSGVYQVQSIGRSQDRMTVPLALIKVDDDWWTLNEGEEPSRPNFATAIEVDATITNIADEDMVIVSQAVTTSSGSAVRFAATFPVPARPDRIVEIEHKYVTDTAWLSFSVQSEDGSGTSSVVSDGSSNQLRWRVSAMSGKTSGWSDIRTISAVADPVAPDALTSFAATGGAGTVNVTYTTANDARTAAVAIYAVATGDPFVAADETPIGTYAASPNLAYSTDIAIAADDWDFYAIPLNGSGVPGTASGPETETVT